jgi:hypothetical protein
MRTCFQKNIEEHSGPTEVSPHTRVRSALGISASVIPDQIGLSYSQHVGLTPVATLERTSWLGSFVPILLQKSFCRRCQKLRGPQARFSCRDLRDLIASR